MRPSFYRKAFCKMINVKAAALVLGLSLGAPFASTTVYPMRVAELSAQPITGVKKFIFFEYCSGPCPGRGALCCGFFI